VGDVFGFPAAIEATAAFFLESPSSASGSSVEEALEKSACCPYVAHRRCLDAFGRMDSHRKLLDADPVGYVIRNGRRNWKAFSAVGVSGVGGPDLFHTVSAAYILRRLLCHGISAYHLLKKQHIDFFHTILSHCAGHGSHLLSAGKSWRAISMGRTCRTNSRQSWRAMEAPLGNEHPGPVYVLLFPMKRTSATWWRFFPFWASEFSGQARSECEVKGLKAFPPADRPPVLINFIAFKTHGGLGVYFALITLYAGSPERLTRVPVC